MRGGSWSRLCERARHQAGRVRARLASADQGWPKVLPLVCIAFLCWLAWWSGIRTRASPAVVHSLGVVSRVNQTPRPNCGACAPPPGITRYDDGAGLRVDMVVSVHPTWLSCGQATVDLVISGTPAFWRAHAPVAQPGGLSEIAVGWDSATTVSPPASGARDPTMPDMARSPVLTAFLPSEPQSGLHPSLFTDRYLATDGHLNETGAFPGGHPVGILTRIFDWAGTTSDVHEYPLHLRFQANWLVSRGLGSCYVLLPSLLANGAFGGTEHALEALEGQGRSPAAARAAMNGLLADVDAPSYGRYALTTNGSFSLSDSSPAPDDFEAVLVAQHGSQRYIDRRFAELNQGRLSPVWSCTPADDLSYLTARAPGDIPPNSSYVGNACGAVAVVYVQGAASLRAFVLIILGVLIALAFEWLVDRHKRKHRRIADSGLSEPPNDGLARRPSVGGRDGG